MSESADARARDPQSLLWAVTQAAAGNVVDLVDESGERIAVVVHPMYVHADGTRVHVVRTELRGVSGDEPGTADDVASWRRRDLSLSTAGHVGHEDSSEGEGGLSGDEVSVPTLSRVIPLAGRHLRMPVGRQLHLISLELWSSMMLLRAAYPPLPRCSLLDRLSWACWDDAGREFRAKGAASTGTGSFAVAHWEFRPAPNAAAESFTFQIVNSEAPIGFKVTVAHD
jgi:hypothetical protein